MSGKVYFIGAGPGDAALVTVRGRDIIARADCILYAGSLVSERVLECARPGATKRDTSRMNLDEIAGEMISAAAAGRLVARVHTGDPSLYGAIAEQMQRLDAGGIAYEIIPGVSAAFAAAAALGVELTVPGGTQTVIFSRRTGRTPVPEAESLQELARHKATLVLFLSAAMAEEVAAELIAGGRPEMTPAAVVYRASWPDEKIVRGTLATIAAQARDAGITRQALIIVGEALAAGARAESRLYSPDFAHGFRAARDSAGIDTAIIAVTRRGSHTGMRLARALPDARIVLPERFRSDGGDEIRYYGNLREEIQRCFAGCARLVLIMATGIAVRMIAPHVCSKWEDPAVVVVDDAGRHAVSLLSGHWGGANALAEKVAHALGGSAVITTESDVRDLPAVDMLVQRLAGPQLPADAGLLKKIQTAILNGDDVGFFPKELCLAPHMEGHAHVHFFDSIEALLCSGCAAGLIAAHAVPEGARIHDPFMLIRPRDLVVGIGCHAGISAEEFAEVISRVFRQAGLSPASIARLGSIERRQNEQGLLEYARRMNIKAVFFGPQDINRVAVPSLPSRHALRAVGTAGVAEPCAVLGAGGGPLVLAKVKCVGMTIAAARIPISRLLTGDGQAHV